MNRGRNKSICRERLLKLQENDINKLIISEIADLAYCNGYNTVLDAAEKVLSNEDYFKIVKQLERRNNMKDYQFEEITFWLSFICCLISYHLNISWLTGILVIVTALNLFWLIIAAWQYLRKKKNQSEQNK